MTPAEVIKIRYRKFPIFCSAIIFTLCTVWLLLGPTTNGLVGKMLGDGGRISIVAIAAILFSAALAVLFLLHAVRAILGLPAIESDGRSLRVYVFPFRDFLLSEISNIDVDNKWINIRTKDGRAKKINLAILDDGASKFDLIKRSV